MSLLGDGTQGARAGNLSTGIAALPISLAIWGRPASNNVWITPLSFADPDLTNEWCSINMISANFEVMSVGGGSQGHSGGGAYSTGVWYHIGGRFFGSPSSFTQDIMKDGVDVGGGASSKNFVNSTGGLQRVGLGVIADSTPSREFDGYIADGAVWTAQLTDQQFALLAAGVSPRLIEQASLVGYWPMMGGTYEMCQIDHSGQTFHIDSNSGLMTVATLNPPIPMDFGWSNRGLHHAEEPADAGDTADVAAVEFALAVPAVTIELGGVTATAAAVSFTLAVPAVTIELGAVTAAVVSVAFALEVPDVTVDLGGAVVDVAAVAFTLAVPAVTIEFGGVTTAVAAVSMNLEVPAVVANNSFTTDVTVVSFTLAVPAVTTAVGVVTADAAAVGFVMEVPTVAIVLGGVTTAPAVVSFTLEVPAVTTTQGTITDAAVVSFALEVPTVAIVLGGVTAAVAAVAFAMVVPGVVVTQPGSGALFPNVLDGSTGQHYRKPKGLQRRTA